MSSASANLPEGRARRNFTSPTAIAKEPSWGDIQSASNFHDAHLGFFFQWVHLELDSPRERHGYIDAKQYADLDNLLPKWRKKSF